MSTSAFSPISQLSQELIDEIVDRVAEIWQRGPLKCVLVSKAFLPRSQFYIFRTLYIKSKDREQRLKILTDIIRKNPSLGLLVQELDIRLVRPKWEYAWIGEDLEFLNLIKQCESHDHSKISKLILRASKIQNPNRGWMSGFTPILNKFFRPLVHPFLTTLILKNLACIPVEIITECTKLVDLQLDNVNFIPGEVDTLTKPTITRLSYRRSRPPSYGPNALTKGWHQCINFSNIKYLDIYKDDLKDLTFEQYMLDRAGASLQVLRVVNQDRDDALECNSFINLQGAANLSILHEDIFFPEEKLDPFNHTLSHIPEINMLSDIRISAYVGVSGPEEPEILLDANWATFCSQIARIAKTHPLRLQFEITYAHHGYTEREDSSALKHRLCTQCESILSTLRTQFLDPMASDCQYRISATYRIRVDLIPSRFMCFMR